MKQFLGIILILASCPSASYAQYWQQEVNYKIGVKLDDKSNSLDAVETILYKNNSADTLQFLWIHLWPNAYKNDKTAFSEQQLKNGNTDFYFSKEDSRGYIDGLSFTTNNQILKVEAHPIHLDIIKVILPEGLAPNSTVEIMTPFHTKLPRIFSRSGYFKNSYQIAQWFPKVAVYDKSGWHPIPYLDQGEFYADFGSYDVSITAASNYTIAATGNLIQEIKDDSTTTYLYKENNIHDFAWFADKNFKKTTETSTIGNNKILFEYYSLSEKIAPAKAIEFMKRSVEEKSKLIGTYPYKTVKVVEDVMKKQAGMEYPTITVLYANDEKDLDMVIHHEIGHNWFQGMLASNERDAPWMDEGLNSFYDKKYEKKYYTSKKPENTLSQKFSLDDLSFAVKTLQTTHSDQPITTASADFNYNNYGLISYEKTAMWLTQLSNVMGEENFDKAMLQYFEEWKFKHPTRKDFEKIISDNSSSDLTPTFALLDKTGPLTLEAKKTKFNFLFNLNQKENTNYISYAPIVGANFYDGLMLGAALHNYNLPPNKFQFLLAPLYATKSKSLNALAKFNYTFYPNEDARHLTLYGNAAKFTGDNFTDSTGKVNTQPYTKIVGGIKYVFGNLDPLKKKTKWIELKSYYINETELLFQRNPTTSILEISYPKESYQIQQLILGIANDRVLYPFSSVLKAELSKNFARLSFENKQYFNYGNGGGINVRLFAGKFLYTNERTTAAQFATERFHFNMSGPKGNEDYEYDNYFVGRNEFDGFAARQIMERDGAFKVKTDFLSNKVGKTDDWLGAINLTSTIPNSINPFSLLPVKIPLKVFFDLGTNADLWNADGNSSKFLYDGGLQLSIFKNVLNIYFPLVYSKVYSNYFKSTIPGNTFKNNISFSINFKALALRKLLPGFNL